jgi:hypothetical protein
MFFGGTTPRGRNQDSRLASELVIRSGRGCGWVRGGGGGGGRGGGHGEVELGD